MPRTDNALTLLHEDHEDVSELLDELAQSTPRAAKKRASLLREIAGALRAHAAIEEETFYPALEAAAKTKEQKTLLAEAREEHRAAMELVLPDLEATDASTIEFGGRAKVLKELVEHHAEEEEKEMFPVAEELLTDEELEDLGTQMRERKAELLGQEPAALGSRVEEEEEEAA